MHQSVHSRGVQAEEERQEAEDAEAASSLRTREADVRCQSKYSQDTRH